MHIAIKVDSFEDMRDAYDHLKGHGVAVDRLIEHANQRSMYFTDPDGNGLEVYYEYPISPSNVRSYPQFSRIRYTSRIRIRGPSSR